DAKDSRRRPLRLAGRLAGSARTHVGLNVLLAACGASGISAWMTVTVRQAGSIVFPIGAGGQSGARRDVWLVLRDAVILPCLGRLARFPARLGGRPAGSAD